MSNLKEYKAKWSRSPEQKEKQKLYRESHKSKIKIYRDEYRKQHAVEIKESKKEYRENHRSKINEYQREYNSNKRKTNVNFRISRNLGGRLYRAIKGYSKSAKTLELLGCSIECLKQHLVLQFKSGMSWENYGEWHIDHKNPCVKFDMNRPEEQYRCFHYTNLQPLWAEENLKKRSSDMGNWIKMGS